jgi:hypothetical protein
MASRSPASVRSSPSVRAARADLPVGLLSRGGRGPFYESFLHEKRQDFRIYPGMVREAD